jgi:Fic family protein
MPAPLSSADALYRGFPDFAAWGPLAPEDAELWHRFAASLEERRRAATPEALKHAVDVAVRAAALDTGAIEGLYDVDRGFTMTVAVQGLAWEQMIEERGAGVRELFEAQLAAYELVLDAATQQRPLTEAWIRGLHETLCAPQETYRVLTSQGWQEQPFPKGRYKSQPNHVRLKNGTFHAYAPVDLVPSEMHRLLEQIRGEEFESAHPILQASYVHYALVVIHPFADGNGRVARALASVFFYRALSIPFLVFANQRLAYFDTLRAADLGVSRSLLTFFRDRGIDTMQLVTEGLMTAEAPAPERGLSPEELEDVASRLRAEIGRPMAPDSSVRLLDDPSGLFRFRIAAGASEDFLDVRLEDVYPELSPSFKLRLNGWIRRHTHA